PLLSVSPDLMSHGSTPLSRPVWKSAGVWPSSIGGTVMQRRRPDWRLAMGLGFSRSQTSYLSRLRRTTARELSWNGLGCAGILLRISTILRFQKVIHSEGMSFTGSARLHISACADFRLLARRKEKEAHHVRSRMPGDGAACADPARLVQGRG